MSNEKMILVRSLGYIVPQSAILNAALVRKEEQTHVFPQLSIEANPIVETSKVMAYYLYLAIDPKFIPTFADNTDDAEAEEEKPRRGRKAKVEALPVETKPATFMIALHEDLLEDRVQTELSKSTALHDYLAQDGENIEMVKKNFGRLAQFVGEMNAQQDSIAPEMPAVFDDLIPSGLQQDITRTNTTAIEIHGDQMRKGIEKSRANYDKVINWFQRKVLVSTAGSADLVNVHDVPLNATERDGADEIQTSLTVKILLDLVKTELTVLF